MTVFLFDELLAAAERSEAALGTSWFHAFEEQAMQVGVMTVSMHLPGVASLKDKRHIVKSVIGRLQSRFNVSVSEVEHQDSKTLAVLGIAVVSNDAVFVDQQLDSILQFMRNDGRFYLGQVEREVFS